MAVAGKGKNMKITIIGTTSYQQRMITHRGQLIKDGHMVLMPIFDHDEKDELGICELNRVRIEWADEVHIFWDQRSMGTIFDFGMCFAMRKRIKIIYMEPKTFKGVMEKYEKSIQGQGYETDRS